MVQCFEDQLLDYCAFDLLTWTKKLTGPAASLVHLQSCPWCWMNPCHYSPTECWCPQSGTWTQAITLDLAESFRRKANQQLCVQTHIDAKVTWMVSQSINYLKNQKIKNKDHHSFLQHGEGYTFKLLVLSNQNKQFCFKNYLKIISHLLNELLITFLLINWLIDLLFQIFTFVFRFYYYVK